MFVVFDLDGTLADIKHRLHFLDKKDWGDFFKACVNDLLNIPVYDTMQAHIEAGHRVEIWSGRSDIVREETEQWLKNFGIDPRLLTNMRPEDDYTPDVDLKRGWLRERPEAFWPNVVYDDRQRVVDMWRSEGVTCFQVCANWEKPKNIAPVGTMPLLSILVGPSGAGKSHWAKFWTNNHVPDELLSSDNMRAYYCNDFRDQSRNKDVFDAIHRIARVRLECGLPVTIDATNLKRKDRMAMANLAPEGVKAEYLVFNRPMKDKIHDGGWRNEVKVKGLPLMEYHENVFQSNLKDILAGDGLEHVTVEDLRK